MIRKYIIYMTYSAAILGLFASPTIVIAQEQTMTREERIKALERLKMEDAQWEKVPIVQMGKNASLDIEKLELPPLSVFLDAVSENATVKRAQSEVEQTKNAYRIEKRNWWNYLRINGNYSFGRFNTLNENSDTYVDWFQSTSVGTRHTFNIGASLSIGLGDLFNRPLKLKDYRYRIEQLQYTQDEVMEERRLKVLEAYNAVTEQLATIKAKAETAALYNAQMKISENNFIQGKKDIDYNLNDLRAAANSASTVYYDEGASQEEIDKACADLKAAQAAVTKKSAEAQITEMNGIIDQLEALNEKDYTKDSWSVYYRGRKVEGASVSSFADLGGGYGKDNWTVYYRGWKVEGASASSFADLGGGYGKDNWTVFYEGRKLEGASAMSFEYKGRGYGKDNWNTYFRGEQLRPGQSPDGMLGGGYAKDSWSVYYRGRKVEGVSASSFEYLGGGYGKDPWKVVYQGREVPGASSSSFEELGWGYARDAWKVYYCGEVIPGASPATFRIPDRR